MVHRFALASAMAVLVGCAAAPQQPPLPDPQTVPRQQWSDALTVFDAMGLKGQRDVPKELVGQAQGQGSASNVSGGAGDLVAGPSVGVGLGMFLLGGGGAPSEGLPQIAAWVPESLASSPEQANRLVISNWNSARSKVLHGNTRNIPVITARYPYGWNPSVAFANTKDGLLDQPIQFDGHATARPSFLKSRQAYGPIFIYPKSINIEASDASITAPEYMAALAKELPNWFYLYYPGSKYSKLQLPAAVYNEGSTLRFVSK
ncbi:hypothetical protein [Pseudomonas nitroreducens]|uniref:hypothetical protein n=1 Tax=Pseudomonas nitroreducens TaxID=46680 RepID=UPI001875EACB|nr:hypothetical protein [Pseudomonas nitritireducens]